MNNFGLKMYQIRHMKLHILNGNLVKFFLGKFKTHMSKLMHFQDKMALLVFFQNEALKSKRVKINYQTKLCKNLINYIEIKRRIDINNYISIF